MKTLNVRAEVAELAFSFDEVDLLRNGLNEARLALKGEADFQTRLGSTRDEAHVLIHQLIEVIREMADKHERQHAAGGRTDRE